MKSNDKVEKDILTFLFKKAYIGKKHTLIKNVCDKLNQYSCKLITKGIKSLVKKRYINLYNTKHGVDVRLEPANLQEIKEIIKIEQNNI